MSQIISSGLLVYRSANITGWCPHDDVYWVPINYVMCLVLSVTCAYGVFGESKLLNISIISSYKAKMNCFVNFSWTFSLLGIALIVLNMIKQTTISVVAINTQCTNVTNVTDANFTNANNTIFSIMQS